MWATGEAELRSSHRLSVQNPCQDFNTRAEAIRSHCYPLRRSLRPVRPDELERRLQERLDALGPAPRPELLHVLMQPDSERADRIGEFRGYPESRSFAELLINCEEDRTLRPVLLGMLREADRSGPGRR
jgi:hypothetical protein